MNIRNYVYANSGLQVNFMKVGEDPAVDFNDAVNNLKSINKTIFLQDFKSKDGGQSSTIWGQYYYQTRGKIGVFSVYRKTPDQQFYQHICELTDEYEFVDYNITDKNFYHYLVAFKTDETDFYTVYQNATPSGDEEYINPVWDGWSITNIIETDDEKVFGQIGDVWLIKYNLSAGKLTSNTSVTSWNTLGRFPKFSVGKQNYKSSDLTCMLGDIVQHIKQVSTTDSLGEVTTKTIDECGYTERLKLNSVYSREVEKYIAWDKFINDGELKLLKDNKGHSWIIQVQAAPTAEIDYNSNLQQTVISFTWQEAMDKDGVSIISNSIFTEK